MGCITVAMMAVFIRRICSALRTVNTMLSSAIRIFGSTLIRASSIEVLAAYNTVIPWDSYRLARQEVLLVGLAEMFNNSKPNW